MKERIPKMFSLAQPRYNKRFYYGIEKSQFGDLRLPKLKGSVPVVVGIHGGWWREKHGLETHSFLCDSLTKEGYASWNIEYRRIGEKGGGWPGSLVDVINSIRFLENIANEYSLDISRVIPIGFSAGAQLTMIVANHFQASAPVKNATKIHFPAVISLAGPLDLIKCHELNLSEGIIERFMGGAPQTIKKDYVYASPIENIPKKIPQLLIHGTEDLSIPVEISEIYYQKAKEEGAPCKLEKLKGFDHFSLIEPQGRPWESIKRFVKENL